MRPDELTPFDKYCYAICERKIKIDKKEPQEVFAMLDLVDVCNAFRDGVPPEEYNPWWF